MTQVLLKDAELTNEEKLTIAAEENVAAKIIVTIRKWLGDEGLRSLEVQSNSQIPETSKSQSDSKTVSSEKLQIDATPGLEAVKEGVS